MPSQPRRPTLTPERAAALRAELLMLQANLQRAEEDLRVHISRSYDAGMTLQDVADTLGLASTNTAKRWKDHGEQARARRSGEDPLRSGEREPIG